MVLAPLATVAFWGSSYMLDCIRTLESPGVPFEYSFHTRSGDLTIAATSYSLSPQQGTLYVLKPELRDSAGQIIIQLDSLEATGLKWLAGSDQVLRIRAKNLQGRLARLPNGKFDFPTFLPEGQAAAGRVPFDIDIDRSRVDYVDQTGGNDWKCTISAPRVMVAGLGQDWVASAKLDLSSVGTVDAHIQNMTEEGMLISGSTQSVQLAAVGPHFLDSLGRRTISELKSASCQSLLVRGPFRVFVPRGRAPNFEASIDARAIGVKYQSFLAQTASFTGRVTAEGMSGVADIAEQSSTATFRGSALWSKKPRSAGELIASAPSDKSLPAWMKALVPKNAGFQNGSFHGWISIQGPNDYHVSGDVEAQSASIGTQRIESARFGLEAEKDRIVVDLRHALLAGEPLTGIFSINPKTRAITGSANAQRVDLAAAGAQFGFNQVAGDASVVILVDGTVGNPGIDFLTRGQGIATILKDHTISLGQFEMAGRYANGSLELNRGLFNTPEGLLAAHGSLGQSGNLGVQVTGRGVLLAAYDPRLSGQANIAGTITGTVKDPKVIGRVEGYDVTYKTRTIPALVADFQADRRGATFGNLEAARGTASLTGAGSIEFRTGNLDGTLSVRDVQLADWLGDEFVGAVDIPIVTVSGTISHPQVESRVQGTSLVLRGVKVDKLGSDVHADGAVLSVKNMQLTGADGSLSMAGSYDLDRMAGTVSASLAGVSIEKLLPELTDATVIHGKVSAKADFSVLGSRLSAGQASGTLSAIVVNGTTLGDGDWNVHAAGGNFSGDVNLGGDSRFVRLAKVVVDPELRKASGELSALHVPIENLLSTAVRYLPDLSIDAKDSLLALEGSLSFGCVFDGTQQDPNLKVTSLDVSDMSYHKQPIGDLNASFDLDRHKWDLHSLTLANGPASISMHGTIDERGETHIDATNDNRFDLAKMSLFDSRLSRLTGTAHLWLTADGPTRSPRIVASLNFDNLFAPPGLAPPDEHDDRYLRLEFDKIVLDPENSKEPGAQVSGIYYYKGFQGTITANVPFEYPFTVPEHKPLNATVTFDGSELKTIGGLVGGLDPERTSGTASGHLNITGTWADLAADGNVSVQADTLAFTALDDVLRSARVNVVLSNKSLSVDGTAKPARGGQVAMNASIPLQSINDMETDIRTNGIATLLDRSFSGQIHLSSAQIHQRVFGQSVAAGTAQSDIQVEGTLRKPKIVGNVDISSGDMVVKALTTPKKETEERLIDPSFGITVNLKDPARLRSSTADMYLLGKGSLSGSLQYPIVEAALNVERGTVRLPAALLRLEQGGTVKVTYGGSGSSPASAIVDMEGTTSVTATRFTDSDVQRYDITLGFKGDLLQDNGLILTPSSDPPDLSADRILGILGQADLLQTLSNGGNESSAIQNAMLSTVPMLLDPYTGQVARGLGLDFLNVEYNSYDLASVAFGKVLGSGFSVEGTRQVSEPPPGFPPRYDLRLLYRPRRLPGALNRVRFYIGSAQDAEWKIGLEYGVRF